METKQELTTENIETEQDYNIPPPPIELDEDIEDYIELEEKINKEHADEERQSGIISRLVIARENVRNALHDLRSLNENDTNEIAEILNSLDKYIVSNCKHNYIDDVIELNNCDGGLVNIRYCANCFSSDEQT